MRARAAYFPSDTDQEPLPDLAALAAHYTRLITVLNVFVLTGNFSGALKKSVEIGRAARALIKGKVRVASEQAKAKMLRCPGWRARVIADLGGTRKLALWNAAMGRAIARERSLRTSWEKPQAAQPAPVITPATIAAAKREAARRAHIRDCAKACANPRIFKDPFRVDQDGLFRLPPVPRVPMTGSRPATPCDYAYDARKLTKLTGAFAPAMVWPIEFYIAERGKPAKKKPVKVFAYGPTPGGKRRPARRHISDRKQWKNVRRQAVPLRRSPRFAPP